MQPQKKNSRIDIAQLKAQIVNKVGSEKSKQYLYYLNRFLSNKLSKSELDKFCNRILGRDNLPLHNLFTLSILKNACNAKTPPSTKEAGPVRSFDHGGHGQSGSVRSNGIVLPMSPRESRSCRLRDRPNPSGTHEIPDKVSHQSTAIKENGDLTPCGYLHPTKQLQDHAELSVNHRVLSFQQSLQIPCVKKSIDKHQIAMEHETNLNAHKVPLLAPFGIPFCSASVGGAHKILPGSSSNNSFSFYDSGGLYGAEALKKRMEQIGEAHGLKGVSLDCATIMNNMVDVHLKNLIKSCVELVGPRSRNELKKQLFHNQTIQNMQEQKTHCPISLLDFKVAMELNPQQLGEDWPLLLDKICLRAFEE